MNEIPSFSLTLQPTGRRMKVTPSTSLLEAAQAAGVALVAPCGGAGLCGKCRVRIIQGTLTPPTNIEVQQLGEAALDEGWRLACQARPRSDVVIEIPPDSLSTAQRLQVEGEGTDIAVDSVVTAADLTLSPPTLDDLRADTSRLQDACTAQGLGRPAIAHPVLQELPERLRAQGWQARLALRRGTPTPTVVGVLPPGTQLLGLAVDLGSTKVAAYLVALESGRTLAKAGQMNPQIPYGEDVVSRIAYTNGHPRGRQHLQGKLIGGLNDLIAELCEQAGTVPEQIVEAVVVGNTVMHHLFAGLPVRQLGSAPYVPAASEALTLPANELGLGIAAGARVSLPPNIAGYVGSDHVAMLLATGAWQAKEPTIALDIGTNTEISLAVDGTLLSCSCASGPAFEGAHIHAGMRAAPGAIEAVHITGEQVRVQTIDGQPPVGLCGSGILDAVAELQRAGIVEPSGRMRGEVPGVRSWQGGGAFLLVPASESGSGEELLVTRRDVHEIQLAKGAIRAGVEVLLQEAGLASSDIARFLVAGAFGTYLNLDSAIRIGMFPDLPRAHFRQVGNAAGAGARQLLISAAYREVADGIAARAHYVELTTHPAFTERYMAALMLS